MCKHQYIHILTDFLSRNWSSFHDRIFISSLACVRMPLARPTKQKHVCRLCGKSGHNISKCDLPGAGELRRLRLYKRKHAGETPKDFGRKKSRIGFGRKNKKRIQKATKEYSGLQAWKQRKNVKKMRKRNSSAAAVSREQIQHELKELQAAGFLQKPGRCHFCNRGWLYENQRSTSSHVLYRCSDNDCRKSIAALSLGSLFPKNIGRACNAKQLNDLMKQYAYATSALNVLTLAKVTGVHHKAIRKLFDWFRAAETYSGTKLNDKQRLKGSVEVDASKLRTIKVGRNSTTWAPEIAQFIKNGNKKNRKCKYYIIHFSLIGAFARSSSACVIETTKARILAPSSRPTAESLEDVHDSGIFPRLAKGAVPRLLCCLQRLLPFPDPFL